MQGNGAHEESILQVCEVIVQGIFADGQSLGFEGVEEFLHAERPGGIAEEVALKPA